MYQPPSDTYINICPQISSYIPKTSSNLLSLSISTFHTISHFPQATIRNSLLTPHSL